MNNAFLLGKAVYSLKKSLLPKTITMQELRKYCYDIQTRKTWDSGLVNLKLIETLNKDNKDVKKNIENISNNDPYETNKPESYIVHSWFKSPIMFVSDREFIEKRIEFIDNGQSICFSTSVPEKYIQKNDNVVRCLNYFNIQIISQDKESFIFTFISQSDLKMLLPEKILNYTLPSSFNGWFERYIKALTSK